MIKLETYIKDFKTDVEKRGGTLKNHEWKFNKDNLDFFCDAVYQGYLDACRTFGGIRDIDKSALKENVFQPLAEEIKNFFQSSSYDSCEKDGYDKWHNDQCIAFRNKLNSIKNQEQWVKYGQAQKVVNMTFKYLFCCIDNKSVYYDYFKYCHMPLDGYTLNWFKNKIYKTKDPKPDYKVNEWSKLDDDTYKKIQDDIRAYFDASNNQMTVLENEFIIWSDENVKDAIKNIEDNIKRIKKSILYDEQQLQFDNEIGRDIIELSDYIKGAN